MVPPLLLPPPPMESFRSVFDLFSVMIAEEGGGGDIRLFSVDDLLFLLVFDEGEGV